MSPYSEQRQLLVEQYVKRAGVTDKRVLKALLVVPRHDFVPKQFQEFAYEDRPLPIDNDQTISQPSLVGLMTQLLKLKGTEKILEIGTGSGYQAAILSLLAKEVISIERIRSLTDRARKKLNSLGYTNITVINGDGSKGYKKKSPYDGIIVTAAARKIHTELVDQLADQGRLVIPIHINGDQVLRLGIKKKDSMVYTDVEKVSFVPMIVDK
ncbi:MAG: protein-L-isoaspartate(D-aspartate) O-methyltransferase [Candidatus Roizmanbacteria bacterium]|nr:protein-L-isoaspartate(D-aspartate) O-methyltransferase [Candidatus Roizmanbacteria bacterium]